VSALSATRRKLILNFVVGAAVLTPIAWGEQPPIPRIGVLVLAGTTVEEGLREGLRDLGYVEGQNMLIEERRVSAQTDAELRSAVADLARAKADVIVVFSTPAARAVMQTTKIPVVFIVGDPVGTGLAPSLAHPGQGTGVSMLNRELAGKRMELLQRVAPGIRRIVFLLNSSNPLDTRMLDEAQTAGRTLGLEVMAAGARNAEELDTILHRMPRSTGDGLMVSNDLLFIGNRAKIAQAVRKAKLPAMFPFKGDRDDGALISYGPSVREGERKLAVYVDKILKGAKPSDLPIEQMPKLELVVDLRTARAMGIHVPEDLLLRADEVIR